MTTVAVAVQEPRHTFDLMVRQAEVLSRSRIIPRAYQGKEYDIIAAGLAGQAFGWDLMTSLRNYHVIEGTASMRPEAMLGLVRRAGHSVTLTLDDGGTVRKASAHGKRADNGDEHLAVFTTDDAKAAGLLGKNNWKQYEDAMLTWRAVSALCRVLFPDVVLGAGYVPEELGAVVTNTGDVVEADPFAELMVDVSQAKHELLETCGGDKALARELWADRGSNPISRDDLDALMAQALAHTAPQLEQAQPAVPLDDLLDVQDAVLVVQDSPQPTRAKLGSKATNNTQEDTDQ